MAIFAFDSLVNIVCITIGVFIIIFNIYTLIIGLNLLGLISIGANTNVTEDKIKTYRIDRMAELLPTGEPKEGKELFEKLNIDQFVKRKFQMMSGESTLVSLQFTASLLDTVLDRFGTKGVNYRKIDDHHFTVQTYVEVSDQFFAWLCGFGRRVKILAPESLKEQYKNHLDNIGKLYEKTEA